MGSSLMGKRDYRYAVLGTAFFVVKLREELKKGTARCLVQPVKRQFLCKHLGM